MPLPYIEGREAVDASHAALRSGLRRCAVSGRLRAGTPGDDQQNEWRPEFHCIQHSMPPSHGRERDQQFSIAKYRVVCDSGV